MARIVSTFLLVLVVVGGSWALLNRDQIKDPADAVNLVRQKIAAFGPSLSPSIVGEPISQPAADLGPLIRIASFKLTGYETTVEHAQRLPLLTDICRRYDAIALQGIDGRDEAWLQLLVGSLNANRRQADYHYISDLSLNASHATQSAIVFNRQTLDLDPLHWYTVNDPDNLLQRPPLVGWFRTRMQNPQDSFTFSLANVELNSVRPDLELAYLGELYRAIRDDGRGEDDVIIAGDFNSGDRGFESVRKRAGLTWVVSNTPTDIRNTTQYDNLVFSESATVEFTGNGGVFDFLRKYNLRLEQAVALSERMPVWAEFSAIEGRTHRRLANQSTQYRTGPK